ncbi:MAG: hypothetical protein LBJ41_07635 [Treponema sp.]|jgi:hypothetical protein|nr:hypothetical protein [Treponema sp.]
MLILGAGLFAFCTSEPYVRDGQTVKSESEALVNLVEVNPPDFSEVLGKIRELVEMRSGSGGPIVGANMAIWEVSAGQLMLFASSESGDLVLVFNEVEYVD